MPTKEELRAAIEKALAAKTDEDELAAYRARVVNRYGEILDKRYVHNHGSGHFNSSGNAFYGEGSRKKRQNPGAIRRKTRKYYDY